MTLQEKKDLRIVKTISAIRSAFEELICEKDYNRITVKELCSRAKINKKTFYHYYETLDHLLWEIQAELSAGFLERVKEFSLPEELDKVNREFFLYAAEQGPAYEKITCGGTYHVIRDEMIREINNKGWSRSKKYRELSDFEKNILMGYINNSVLTIHKLWVEDGKSISLEDVVALTNRIVLGGVSGFFGQKG